MPYAAVRKIFQEDTGREPLDIFETFDPEPIACMFAMILFVPALHLVCAPIRAFLSQHGQLLAFRPLLPASFFDARRMRATVPCVCSRLCSCIRSM